MQLCKCLINSLFIFLLLLSPEVQASIAIESTSSSKVSEKQTREKSNNIVPLEAVLQLIDRIENDEQLESNLTEEEIEKVNLFISTLAANGLTDEDKEEYFSIGKDINDLIGRDYSDLCFRSNDPKACIIIPTVFDGSSEVFLCKSWLSKKWKKTKKFVKKHKKAIIIGAVVVVAVAVIVTVAVCSVGAAAAAGTTASSGGGNALAGAAAGGAAIAAKKDLKEEKTGEEKKDIKLENSLVLLKEEQNKKDLEVARVFNENIDSCKKNITEDLVLAESIEHEGGIKDPSTLEKLQTFGSVLAHDIVDGVLEMTDFVPRLAEEIETVGKMILPKQMLNNGKLTESLSPTENFEETFVKSHELIDIVFSTDLAKNSKSKYKEDASSKELVSKILPEPTLGILPPPGGIPKLFSNANKLIKAGNVLDRAQFTKVGRGLMKHGYRKGSSFFKPHGNPSQINAQGQQVLESILNHPERTYTIRETRRLGKTVDIFSPDRGVRYTLEGEFIGFLEPGKGKI